MRTIEINGQSFEVRSLKRGTVKQFRKDGINLFKIDLEKAEEAIDQAFEEVFTADQIQAIDELLNADAMKLWQGILLETYGAPGEEKNSEASGNGCQTEKE